MGKETINIYLNKEDRKQMDLIKNKYQLSLTTIVDILCFETYHTFLQYAPLQLDVLTDSYMYSKGAKTSIKKPHVMSDKEIFKNQKHKSRFATNVLMIYLKKDIKKYVEYPNAAQEYWNRINNKMNNTKDEWWGYNQHIRYERRSLKENREYYQAELDKMKNGKSN